jgi:hypothetical protein
VTAADRESPRNRNVLLQRGSYWLLLTAGLTVLACVILWPAFRYPYSMLPAGASRVVTVPLFNAWTIWWNTECLSRGLQHYWNAPIFWPNAGTFAFSEPQPATLLVAPVVWMSGSVILAYNVYLLMSLVANGIFAARLLRTLRVGRWARHGAVPQC